jgi:CO/xanthine dehydrogenase FAD-binding subunit
VTTVAVRIVREGGTVTDARIALGAAGPHPLRAIAAEAVITGSPLDPATIARAADAAAAECDPFTDAVASEWYRRRMVGVVVRRALEELMAPAAREDA